MGVALLYNGQLLPAMTHFEQALALYDPAARTSAVYLWGPDTRVACLLFTALILLFRGFPDQALARNREALAAASGSGHAYTTSQALYLTCWLHQIRGDQQGVRERAATLMALTTEHGLAAWAANATILHGWAVAAGGATATGIAQLREGLAAGEAIGVRQHTPSFLGLLAETLHRCRESRRGAEAARRGIGAGAPARGALVRGGAAAAEGRGAAGFARPTDLAEAEACYRQALDVARGQSARLWELRAATSLARLWRDQGKRAEARDLLAPVYDWFTEGFDTADLKDAKALLDELA